MAGLIVLAVVIALLKPILERKDKESEMNKNRNFFQRALDAVVEGRARQAERYVARFERDHDITRGKVNGR